MNNSLKELIGIHFKSFFREPAALFWAVLFPILMSWVLGIAFTGKGVTERTVYVTGTSELPAQLKKEGLFGKETGNAWKVKFQSAKVTEATTALQRGIISLYIEVKGDSLIYHFDPANPDAQLTHLMIERELSGRREDKATIAPLTATGTRYIDFLIPGLIAFGIMNSCLWGVSWNLIEFRMKKLLRRMVATPMKKPVFFFSHIFTRLILSSFESLMLILFAYFIFSINITGSVLALIMVFVSGVFAFSGIGILTASRTGNSQVGNGLINAVTIPMTILSGVFFNYHNFPDWAIPVIQALPLTLLADAVRAVFVEGAGVSQVFIPALILFVTGLVSSMLGLKIFKWY